MLIKSPQSGVRGELQIPTQAGAGYLDFRSNPPSSPQPRVPTEPGPEAAEGFDLPKICFQEKEPFLLLYQKVYSQPGFKISRFRPDRALKQHFLISAIMSTP